MNPVIAIIGPTASGKSDLAIRIATEFDGEVISADSRQIFRYMDIGTAKLTTQEQSVVPHHLIDIVNPDSEFSLASFRQEATRLIGGLHEQGKLPVIAGGTGQYVWGLLEGWTVPAVEPDPALRAELERRAADGEGEVLYRELQEIDPAAAENIDPRNIRRVIRAIEVVKQTGKPFSQQRTKEPPPFDVFIIGLTADRKKLYWRIDDRVDRMVEAGFVDEVRGLLEKGFSRDLPAMSGIGYRQIIQYLDGELSFDDAITKIKTETHRLVRKQYNWFRLTDERIHWQDITSDYTDQAIELVRTFLNT